MSSTLMLALGAATTASNATNITGGGNSTGGDDDFHRQVAAVPLTFTCITACISCYNALVLVTNTRRFYHLWNRIALLLFCVIFVNSLFRIGIQSYDIYSAHATLSDTACRATYALNEFFSAYTEMGYVTFQLTMSVPWFSEPDSREQINSTLFWWVLVPFAWSALTITLPLATHAPLEHRRAWCWLSSDSSMRWAFFYVPAVVSFLVALGFTIWVIAVQTRVPKIRVLTFAFAQLIVVAVFMVFALLEAADHPDLAPGTHSVAFDLFAGWITIHEAARALAFAYGERFFQPKVLLCPRAAVRDAQRGAGTPTAAAGAGAVDTRIAGTTATAVTDGRATTATATPAIGGGAPSRGGPNESTELIGGAARDPPSAQQPPSRDSFDDAAVDARGNLTDDTLTYFVLHLQRRSADLDADWKSSQSDGEESAYAGGRGASMRRSDYSVDDSASAQDSYGSHLA